MVFSTIHAIVLAQFYIKQDSRSWEWKIFKYIPCLQEICDFWLWRRSWKQIFEISEILENEIVGIVGKFKVRGDRNTDIICPAWWYMGKFRFHYCENDLVSST